MIERARNRVIDGYVERHHIIPRSLGGTDDPSNIVALTAREHLVAHMLLPRFVGTPGPMWQALWCMVQMGEVRVTGRLYEQVKIRNSAAHSAALKGRPNLALKGRPNPRRGIARSEETKAKISAAKKGRKQADWVVEAKRQWARGKKRPDLAGIPRSEETKAKIAATLKGKKRPAISAGMKEYWAKKKLASSEEVV